MSESRKSQETQDNQGNQGSQSAPANKAKELLIILVLIIPLVVMIFRWIPVRFVAALVASFLFTAAGVLTLKIEKTSSDRNPMVRGLAWLHLLLVCLPLITLTIGGKFELIPTEWSGVLPYVHKLANYIYALLILAVAFWAYITHRLSR
jgi:hypothetical protein